MIYLDNSSSTFIKPKEVVRAVNDSLIKLTANPGRAGHRASINAALAVQSVREKLAHFVGCPDPCNVIFTSNCTEALNLAILGSARDGGHVVCTENEHNSVIRPLEKLKERGISYSVARQHQKGRLTVEDIKAQIRPETYLIIANHVSNVNGDYADIKAIGQFAHEKGLLFLVDGAQSVGHEDVDMAAWHINMLSIAGHKGFYAPQAVGALCLNGVQLEPIKFGGTGVNSLELVQPQNSPERYESGTLSTPLIMGLGAGIDFVSAHYEEIRNRLDDLTTYVNYELSKLPVKSYTHPSNSNGVLSFNIADIDSAEVANYLDEKWAICVRGGLHCAPTKHKALGTLDQGTVRVSFSYFNNYPQAEKLIQAIKVYLRKLKLN